MSRRLTVVFGVAILLVSSGCNEKSHTPGPGLTVTNVPVLVRNDSTTNSCYLDNAWPTLSSSQTITFATSSTNGYRIVFSAPYPLVNSSSPSVGVPYIDVTTTPSAVQYQLSSAATTACSATSQAGCFVPFDIQAPAGGGGTSCVKHLGNYSTGIHIDR